MSCDSERCFINVTKFVSLVINITKKKKRIFYSDKGFAECLIIIQLKEKNTKWFDDISLLALQEIWKIFKTEKALV